MGTLRVPTPNVSIVDLVVKVGKKCTKEGVNAAVKAAADGKMKGIINFEEQPLVSSAFMQTDYSNSVDAALTMVMRGPGEGRDVVRQRVGLFAACHRPDSHCCSKNASGSLGLQPAVLQKFSYNFWSTLRCRSCEIDTITDLRHRLLT